MKLSERQIKKLLDWFIKHSKTRKRWLESRKRALKENHKWIQLKEIKKISDKELKKHFLKYYNDGGGRQNLNKIYRDRIIRNKTRFRQTVLYLLNENVPLENRLDDILKPKSKYRIEGFGKAILTSFLMDFNPNKYCIWNNKTEMGFEVLGLKTYEPKDSWVEAYSKILKILRYLKNLKKGLTFDDIDMFLHTISAEDEGIRAVDAVINRKNIPQGEFIEKSKSPSFKTEKQLEDCIKNNFNKIFGSKLELYQDEENDGSYRPTPAGTIDLLAIDKRKKNFVVIELKLGRPNDVVVAQTLRYIGYIKNSLAKEWGYNVKGIIIAEEIDKKINYALEMIPDLITLFTYNTSILLKKTKININKVK